MPDPRLQITPEAIAATWADPEFAALPEQERIDIMGRMDPVFGGLRMIEQRRVTSRMFDVFGPKPIPQRGPAPLVNETASALAESGLPPARPAGAPPAANMDELGVMGALTPSFRPRGPMHQAPAPAPPPQPAVVAPPTIPPPAPLQPPPAPVPTATPLARALRPVPDPAKAVDPWKAVVEQEQDRHKLLQQETKTKAAQENFLQQVSKNKSIAILDEQKAQQQAAKTEQHFQKIDQANQKAQQEAAKAEQFSEKADFERGKRVSDRWESETQRLTSRIQTSEKELESLLKAEADKANVSAPPQSIPKSSSDPSWWSSVGVSKEELEKAGLKARIDSLKKERDGLHELEGRRVPGMEKLGGIRPNVPSTPIAKDLKKYVRLPTPQLEYDPFTGGAKPVLGTPLDQHADYMRNDPLAVGVGAAVRGFSGATMNAAGGLTKIAADATGSTNLNNIAEGLNLGDRLVQDAAGRPEDVVSFDEDPVGAASDPRWWADSIGNGMGSMIPMLASGAAAGKVISTALNRGWLTGKAAYAVLKYGPSAVAGLSEGIMAAGNTYNEAIEAGASPEIAREAAALVAAGTAATAIPAFKVGVFQDRIQSLSKKVLTSVGAEAGQEGVQSWWENVVAKKLSAYDPKRSLSRGVVEGMVGGGFGGAGGAMLEGAPQKPAAQEATTATGGTPPPPPGGGTSTGDTAPKPPNKMVVTPEEAKKLLGLPEDATQQEVFEAADATGKDVSAGWNEVEGRPQYKFNISPPAPPINPPGTPSATGEVPPKEIPQTVLTSVRIALDRIRDYDRQLKEARIADDKFGGEGRYENEVNDRHDMAEVEKARQTLETFRGLAVKNGIDPDTVFADLGGLAVPALSDRARKYKGGPPAPDLEEMPADIEELLAKQEQEQEANNQRGKVVSVKTAKGYSVDVQYVLDDLDNAQTSHDEDGNENPLFPGDMQPRQRDRAASITQMKNISQKLDGRQLVENVFASFGAPIEGKDDKFIESGNGRLGGIRRARRLYPERFKQYQRDMVDASGATGIDREVAAAYMAAHPGGYLKRKRVGELPSGVSRSQWAKDANEDPQASVSAGEQAMSDSRLLTPEMLATFKPDSDIASSANMPFVLSFMGSVVPEGQHGSMQLPNGDLSLPGINRIRTAIFAAAYKDRGIVERLAEDPDDNIKSIVGGLTLAAPRFISIQSGIRKGDLYDLDISEGITDAASKISYIRENKLNLNDHLNQVDMTGEKPLMNVILQAFGKYGRNKAELADLMERYTDAVEAIGHPEQAGMFGPADVPTPEALFERVFQRKLAEDGKQLQANAAQPSAPENPAGGTGESGSNPGLFGGEEEGPAAAPAPAPGPGPKPGPTAAPGGGEAVRPPSPQQVDAEPYEGAPNVYRSILERVKNNLGWKNTPDLNKFIRSWTGKQVGTHLDQKQAYDAVEAAINSEIAVRPEWGERGANVKEKIGKLRDLVANIAATQTTRTAGQDAAQQYSTPPALAYVASLAAGPLKGKVVLEPSAGTGGLASFAKAVGATVVTNEIDPGRRWLLRQQGFEPYAANAEQIDNLLPPEIQPDVVLMNPPFSSSVTRGGANTNENGYRHVIQALARLKPGGRLVAILGEGAKMGLPNSRNFWSMVQAQATVLADVGMNGEEYRKYGTTFGNRLIVLQKGGGGVRLAPGEPVRGEYNSIEEVWDAIQPIFGREQDSGQVPGEQPPAPDSGDGLGTPDRLPDGDSGRGTRRSSGSRGTRGRLRPIQPPPSKTSPPSPPSAPQQDPEPGPPQGPAGDGKRRQDAPPAPAPDGDPRERTERPPRVKLTEAEIMKALHQENLRLAKIEEEEAEAELRALGFYDSMNAGVPLDPRFIAPLVKYGLSLARRKIYAFKEWSARMLEKYAAVADRIRDSLRDIHDEVIEQLQAFERQFVANIDSEPTPEPTPEPEPSDNSEPELDAPPSIETVEAPREDLGEDEENFLVYNPIKVPTAWGAQPHKAKIVETLSLGGVSEPDIFMRPNIPQEIFDTGALTEVQLPAIAHAIQAHSRYLSTGERSGFFIGDGTGVGKGRTIAGIIAHYWNSGQRQMIWVTKSKSLVADAKRDLKGIGMQDVPVRWIGDFPDKSDISAKFKEGVIVTSYDSLSYSSVGRDDWGKLPQSIQDMLEDSPNEDPFVRVAQLVRWGGKEPVIVLDESHIAKNSAPAREGRGTATASKNALSAVQLQKFIPEGRVVYSSATGFTEPDNLAYANRLGLWGRGTKFGTFSAFASMMKHGGIVAMEMVARDMKAQGKYLARFISYGKDKNGIAVEFDEVVHKISPEQKEILDTAGRAWNAVLQNMNTVFEENLTDATEKRKTLGQYYTEMQRFYRTVFTATKMPSLFREIDAALANDESVVISVSQTGEAGIDRELLAAKQSGEEINLDDLDLSPAKVIQDYVKKHFPVHQYQEIQVGDSTIRVMVKDLDGKPALNRQAVAMRDTLLRELNELRMPETALDQILNKYGADQVAEMTGRTKRMIVNPLTGRRELHKRPGSSDNNRELGLFQDGEKRIAIISDSANAGISLHSDLGAKNQQRRVHIILQLKWSADTQMQDFGRTHRTNQRIPPRYILMALDVAGDKRFASSIARRLGQLGALSRGDRKASNAGSIENYNFENEHGTAALEKLFTDMMSPYSSLKLPDDMDAADAFRILGFEAHATFAAEGGERTPKLPKITQFLNRITAAPVDLQNYLFEEFLNRMAAIVRIADEAGLVDKGTGKIDAHSIVLSAPPTVIMVDEVTGAETFWYELDALHKRVLLHWNEVAQMVRNRNYKLARNIQSEGLVLVNPNTRTVSDETTGGNRIRIDLSRPNGEVVAVDQTEFSERYKATIATDEIGEEWMNQQRDAGEFRKEKVHLIGGSILSIFDRLSSGGRIPTSQIAELGKRQRVLGVRIPVGRIRGVLRSLGFGAKVNAAEVLERIAEASEKYTLAEGLILGKGMVQGESMIQVTLPSLLAYHVRALEERIKGLGVRAVQVAYRDRFFIPTNEMVGLPILKALLKEFPVTADSAGQVEFDDGSNKGPLTRRNSEAGFIKGDFLLEIARGAARLMSAKPGARPQVETFSDPAVEARVQAASIPPADEIGGVMNRLSEANDHLKQLFRTYEFLPRDRYGALIFKMKVLEKARGTASAKALTELYGMIGKMDRPTFEIFKKAVLVDDLMETVELFEGQGESIPATLAFGFTPESLREEKDRFEQLVADNPELAAAMTRRQQAWDHIKAEYLKAMRAAGVDVEGKLARKAYFRHRVLIQKQIESRMESRKVQTPASRSFLKRRKASAIGMDYRTNFIETEFQVMTQIMTDSKMAEFVSWVRDNVDIRSDLEGQARNANIGFALEHFANLADQMNSAMGSNERKVTPEGLFRQTLNRRQAIAVEELMKLAADGKLPDTPDRKHRKVIDALAQAHFAAKQDEQDGVEGNGPSIPGLINYAAWVLRQNQQAGPASRSAATLFKGIRDKKQAIKSIAGDRYVEWDDLMPKGYQEYQPDPRGIYYTAYTIPEQIALKLMEEGAEAIGLTADQLTKVIAVGGQRRTMVLPDDVVNQFKKMAESKLRNEALQLLKESMGAWKQYMLMSFSRIISYTLRNTTGDFDSILNGLPKELLPLVPQAMYKAGKEVGAYLLPIALGKISEAKMTPGLLEFHDFGGFQSTLQAQELGSPDVPKQIRDLMNWEHQTPPEGPLKATLKAPVRALAWQMRKAGEANNFREATMRYAVYTLLKENMAKAGGTGLPSSYGASIPEEVKALGSPRERAYRMSNDLMGAYDEISVAGRAIREHVIPFWSYQELNFRRYARIIQNSAREGWSNEKAGKMAIGAAARAPYLAYRATELSGRLIGLWALSIALNSMFGDDDKLREEVRHRPHFNFGTFADGKESYYFPRIGNLNDILEWFDVEEIKSTAAAVLNGRKSLSGGLWDVVRGGPLEKVFLSAGPHIKYPLEATTNMQFYPNVDRPRQVDDWYEKIAGDLGLADAYKELAGKPSKQRGPLERLASLAIYKVDPRENAYYDTLDQKRKFMVERGMGDSGQSRNKASTVILRNLKKAIRVEDYPAFKKYLTLYAAQPKASKTGLASSIRAMHPLAGLSEKANEKKDFMNWLSNDDRRRLNLAIEYYDDVFRGDVVKQFSERYNQEKQE